MFTAGGEPGGQVLRIGGCVVLLLVTARAVARRSCECSTRVAFRACCCDVRACKWELRMMERTVLPHRCVVTTLAVRGQPVRSVVRIRRGPVVVEMAVGAVSSGSPVASANVTFGAVGDDMSSSQRKRRVIERGALPGRRVMALLATSRQAANLVVWFDGAVVVVEMAVDAVSSSASEEVVPMAVIASDRRV